jgi:hypothetical protein
MVRIPLRIALLDPEPVVMKLVNICMKTRSPTFYKCIGSWYVPVVKIRTSFRYLFKVKGKNKSKNLTRIRIRVDLSF